MGRPRGSKNRKSAPTSDDRPATTQHNKEAAKADLTEDQHRALLASAVKSYQHHLKLKNDATSEFIKACKTIKGDGVSLDDVKTAIKLQTPEGEAKLRAAMEAQIRVARWQNSSIGTQFGLFGEDPPNGHGDGNASFKAGKAAGLAGAKAEVPGHFDVNEWMRGHGEGQMALMANIKEQKARDADEFDEGSRATH